jgi:hypothetical protein
VFLFFPLRAGAGGVGAAGGGRARALLRATRRDN